MKIKIKGTGEVRSLEYLVQRHDEDIPQDFSAEYALADPDIRMNSDGEYETSSETYEWWRNLFTCMERCDDMEKKVGVTEAKIILEEVGFDFDRDPEGSYSRYESALKKYIEEMDK